MYLAADYIHPTPHNGCWRVRIYRPDLPVEGSAARDEAVVICTDLPSNQGMSVTDAAERIAGEVISLHRLPTPLIWIEHYEDGARGTPEDPQTFDLVTFASYEVEDLGAYLGEERKRIGEPSWQSLDRATVEALVGERLKGVGPTARARKPRPFCAPYPAGFVPLRCPKPSPNHSACVSLCPYTPTSSE
jgi:hypothetical protein